MLATVIEWLCVPGALRIQYLRACRRPDGVAITLLSKRGQQPRVRKIERVFGRDT